MLRRGVLGDDVLIVRTSPNLCAAMVALHKMRRGRAVAVLRQLSEDDDTLLITRIRNVFITGPSVFLQHLMTLRVFAPLDADNKRSVHNLYRFLRRAIARFDEETKDTAEQ